MKGFVVKLIKLPLPLPCVCLVIYMSLSLYPLFIVNCFIYMKKKKKLTI